MYSNILGLLIVVIAIVSISEAAFSQTCSNPKGKVYILRHADKFDDKKTPNKYRPISCPKGCEMAKNLVDEFNNIDLSAIYTTDYMRTKQTALPLAKSKNIEPKVIEKHKTPELLNKICENQNNQTIMIVGHSTTIPTILKELCQNTENTESNDSQNYTRDDIEYCDLYVFDFDQSTGTFREDAYCEYP